jgi:hypothetical protein
LVSQKERDGEMFFDKVVRFLENVFVGGDAFLRFLAVIAQNVVVSTATIGAVAIVSCVVMFF